MPCVAPKDTDPEDYQCGSDLGMAALHEEANQLLEGEIDSESVVTAGNYADSTSIWYHGHYLLHRRPLWYKRA